MRLSLPLPLKRIPVSILERTHREACCIEQRAHWEDRAVPRSRSDPLWVLPLRLHGRESPPNMGSALRLLQQHARPLRIGPPDLLLPIWAQSLARWLFLVNIQSGKNLTNRRCY